MQGGTYGLTYDSRGCSFDSGYGPGWSNADELPVLSGSNSSLMVRFGAEQADMFALQSDGSYAALYGSKDTLVHDTQDNLFLLTKPNGTLYQFYDLDQTTRPQGSLCESIAPSGATVIVTEWTQPGVNGQIADVEYRTTPDGLPYQRQEFTYVATADGLSHIQTQTLQQFDTTTSTWTNVREKTYTYYGSNQDFGLPGDLQTITTMQWDTTAQAWAGNDTYYFRYYTAAGQEHELERAILPNAYASFVSAYGDPTDPKNWNQLWYLGDSQTSAISNYTCYYYSYDSDRRVSSEVVFGKSNESDFATTISGNANDYNNWAKKTVETDLNNNTTTTYTNYLGQTLLTDVYDAASGNHTLTYNRYDDDGHLILTADSAAFVNQGGQHPYYDDSLPDLVNWTSGDSPYLSDTDGLFQETVYYASTDAGIGENTAGGVEGYVYETAVAHGETAARLAVGSTGGPILLSSYTYFVRTVGGQAIYPTASYTTYSNEDGTGAATTSYAYTWYSGTFQIEQETTTEPVVSTDQNGSGTGATTQQWFDDQGKLAWSMNELGRVTYNAYDSLTGQLTTTIADIDASTASSLGLTVPSGWTLPSSGGVSAQTDYQHDALNRVTQTLGPAHIADINGTPTSVRTATWTVYEDAVHETWTAQGYATETSPSVWTTYTIVGPISITTTDRDGRVTDQIQAKWFGSALQGLTAANCPLLTDSNLSFTAWTANKYANTRLAATAVYYSIPSGASVLRNADGTFLGTASANYNQTTIGYETFGLGDKGRQNKIVTPDGTITRVV